MRYFKGQNLHERKIQDQSVILKADGDVEINPPSRELHIDADVTVTGNISGPEVTDIIYVNQDGNDSNDGKSMGPDGAKRTIKSAVSVSVPGTTIMVAPGDYYENNPISMPDFVTITGTGELRNTRVFPNNPTSDFFKLGNGCYLYQLTFRGLRAPGWCASIRPGALVTTSPYVQNCTNMNGPWLNDGTEFVPFETVQIDGIEPGARPLLLADYPNLPFEKQINDYGGGGGMLVDGDQYNPASLVKSFVADAFTQIAQGGPGFEITNFGYTQIVSCFTVFCTTGFKTSRGGYLSISNSVSDFGLFGCVADGYYPTSYTSARPVQDYFSSVASITINSPGNGYTNVPTVDIDAPTGTGGTQATASAVLDTTTGQIAGITVLSNGSGYEQVPAIRFIGGDPTIAASATANLQTNSIIRIGSLRDKPQVGSIARFLNDSQFYYITESQQITPPFFYDEEVCKRDTRFIIDAVVGDIVLGTNYQAIAAGRSYLRARSGKVLLDQLTPTIFGINVARDEMIALTNNVAVQTLITEKFAIITNFLANEDSSAAPDINYNDLSTVDLGVRRAKDNIVANKDFIVEEITEYIRNQFTELSYNVPQFETDATNLLKAVAYTCALGSNYHVVRDAQEYVVRDTQKELYLNAWKDLQTRSLALTEVLADGAMTTFVNESFNSYVNIFDDGDSSGITIDFPDFAGVEANRRDSKNQLQANKDFLADEFVAYMKSEHPTLTDTWTAQDETDFYEDFKKIVDALTYDILYTGNSGVVREGFRYYSRRKIASYTAINRTRIADGFARMRNVIKSVVREQVVVQSPGTTETQDFSNAAATSIEADALDSLLFNIEDVVAENTTSRLPLITYPTYDSETLVKQNAANDILNNTTSMISATNAYLLATYPNDTFDRTKCERDTGLIIDAVYRDAQLGTNHNSLTAGQAYYRANVAYFDEQQKPATIMALRKAKELSVAAVDLDSFIKQQVSDRWDDVLEVIEYNTIPSEGRTFESPGPAGQDLIDAVEQIINNREFLTKETTAYINNVYDNGSGTLFVYDSAKCSRDTGLIIDAVQSDVAFGTNYNAVTNGLAYQRAGSAYVQSDQKAQTVGAINFLKGRASTIMTADATAVLRSNAAFDEIVDIINNGVVSTDTAADTLSFPIPTGAAATITAARDRLQANRAFLANDTRAYIQNNFPSLTFNTTKCERDVGYIVDALTYDIVYGGNTATKLAASSYFENATTQVPGEQLETAAGFNHLQGLIEEILLGTSITAQTGNSESQDTSGSNASSTEVTDVEALVQIVEDVVEFGIDTLPATVSPSTAWVDSAVLSARQDFIDLKSSLQVETINYINTTYNGFTYDIEKCERDTAYVIDALCHDLLYTGNIAMLIATRAYFLGATEYLPDEQAAVTGAAWAHLADVIEDVIQGVAVTPSTGNNESQSLNGNYGTTVEATTSSNLLQIIEDAVTAQTLSGTPGEIQPNFSWLNVTQQNAAAQLLAQKAVIQSSVTSFIFTDIVDFEYKTEVCERDTKYIVDAVVYDMMYGGNKQTRRAGLAYYNNAVIAGQESITELTYRYLGDILREIAQNNPITKSPGNTLTQDISIPDGSLAAGQVAELLIDRIAQSIQEGYTTGWTEQDHNYGLGNSTYNIEREIILRNTESVVDEAIKQINATYGGTYDITISPGIITIQNDTLGQLYNVSTISTSGHAFEYVGAGITYNALPFFGGSPIAEQEIIETDQGKVFAGGTVDQIGNFRVGNFFGVNALTGAITLNANEIDLQGLTSVGPFIRDGIPVGVELKEVSNNPNMTASNGLQDINTSPTQKAVATYVENRYLNKLTGGTITGDVVLDGNLDVDGDVLSTAVDTFNLLNTTADTINFGGEASEINIGAATGLVTINPDMLVEGVLTVNGNINFTGDVALTVPVQSLQAYSISVGTEDYVSVNTREGEEKFTFGEQPRVEIQNDSGSTSPITGALVVDGGVGIGEDLFVNLSLNVNGNTRLGTDRAEDSIDINGITDIDVPDDTVDVFRIHENVDDYISINTTDGAAIVEIGAVPNLIVLNGDDATDNVTGAIQVTGGMSAQLSIHAGQDIVADRDLIADRDIEVNGTNIITDETGAFNLLNTNATTINAFGAATTINIGATTGTLTINVEDVIIDSTSSLQVPVGTTAERPTEVQGQIRYNTTDSSFEGYDGTAWGALGGVKDVDQDTFISPEDTPGSDNDQLKFVTANVQRFIINQNTAAFDSSIEVLSLGATTPSIDYQTGALTIAGGLGVAENIHVQGFISGDNSGVLQLTDVASDKLLIPADTILSPDGFKLLTDAPDSAADDIVYPMTLAHHNAAGTPVAGSGTGLKFELETGNNNFELAGQVEVVSTDVTSGQEDFDMVFRTMIGGTAQVEKLRLGEEVSTFTTDIAVNNDTISTNQATFNLLNTDATTVNFAGAATTIAIGATGGLTTLDQNLKVNEDVTIDGTLALTNIDLEVQYGGTGVSTFTEDGILYGDTANPVKVTAAAGTSDASDSFQILTVTSDSDATPVWTDTIDGGSF
jgi:hypothetical protein